MSNEDSEAAIDDLDLTKREAKELRQLVVPSPSAVNVPQLNLGPIQWVKSLLAVALVLALGGTLGFGFFRISKSEWFFPILELLIIIMAILDLYQAAIRGRLVRKLYHFLQAHKKAAVDGE
ncbi:MAG TPA: hypothetical protein VKK31_17030 [Thermoanaerobaculia bacterium]|nr:hypothetical protein [Thermoanaerobaculia bacterium]